MKDLQITPPQGYEVDTEKSTFEKIVFKEVNKFPTSLEDLERVYFDECEYNFTYFTDSKKKYTALTTLIDLIDVRDRYWELDGGWKPDWRHGKIKHTLSLQKDKWTKFFLIDANELFSFRTASLRDKFYDNYKALLEEVKYLYS